MSETPFFIAGDALSATTPSYVTRPADQVLSASVQEGAFCYVLTARQMGKTSLMVRTASHLSGAGVTVAQVDLRSITADMATDWYQELLARLQRQLGLRTDAREWWRARAGLGAPQRFIDFLHDVVLHEIGGSIALFIDEIDATLSLEFRDDFFAAIRAMYNARASDPVYKRLTFVLLGVATPTDLIRGPKLTPFNIGHQIELNEFSYQDTVPLREGLERRYPGQGDRILKRIFDWTNGHPYLTQKLCLAAYNTRTSIWSEAQVDALVTANFFGPAASQDANLNFVRDKVLGAPADERPQMLALYNAVYNGQILADDESSPVQNHLELYGLVSVERGRLLVRNQIYRRVFGQKWIERYMPAAPVPEPPLVVASARPPAWLLALIGVLVATIVGSTAYVLANRAPGGATATQTAGAAQATGTAQQILVATTETAQKPSPTNIAAVPPTAGPALPTAVTEPPTAVAEPATAAPTDTPRPTPTSEPTAEPATAVPELPTAVPTDTPRPIPTNKPTEVIAGQASCVVGAKGVTVRDRPDRNAATAGSLSPGAAFTPIAKSSETNDFVWVKVPAPVGWVYAGDQGTQLVHCTGLGNVPISTN